jgi:hypothetical protein
LCIRVGAIKGLRGNVLIKCGIGCEIGILMGIIKQRVHLTQNLSQLSNISIIYMKQVEEYTSRNRNTEGVIPILCLTLDKGRSISGGGC